MSIIAFKTDTRISGVRVVGGGADRDEMKKSLMLMQSDDSLTDLVLLVRNILTGCKKS
jgi:hypothetical protein